MKKLPVLFFILLFTVSCKQKQSSNKESKLIAAVDSSFKEKETAGFFPVTSYLKGQLLDIQNSGINPLRLEVSKGKTDSTWIRMELLETEFADFLSPSIDSVSLATLFAEKKFFDQTLNSITLTYDPIGKLPDSISFQRWDIYIDPEKNVVQRIYLVKKVSPNSSKQLTWQSGKWCRLVTIAENTEGKSAVTHEVTYKLDY